MTPILPARSAGAGRRGGAGTAVRSLKHALAVETRAARSEGSETGGENRGSTSTFYGLHSIKVHTDLCFRAKSASRHRKGVRFTSKRRLSEPDPVLPSR